MFDKIAVVANAAGWGDPASTTKNRSQGDAEALHFQWGLGYQDNGETKQHEFITATGAKLEKWVQVNVQDYQGFFQLGQYFPNGKKLDQSKLASYNEKMVLVKL